MAPRILVLDIETLPGIVEKFDLKPGWTNMEWVVVPTRVLCFAAKWYKSREIMFHAAWDDQDEDGFNSMAHAVWELLDEADVVVGWNSTRFDIKHLNSIFGRLGLGPPSPFKSLDLMTVARKNFNEMSFKLDWFSKFWLGERKLKHDGIEMWQHIRRGDETQKKKACRVMEAYNIKDVRLTEKIFEHLRPWVNLNYALMDTQLDEESRLTSCPRCGCGSLQSRGKVYTGSYAYDRYRCNGCGGWSRGHRATQTTEFRLI